MAACINDEGIASMTVFLAECYNYRGVAFSEYNCPDDALLDYTEAIKYNPASNGDYYFNRALIYNIFKEYDNAIADCNMSIKLSPEKTRIYHTRAFA
jgi:tetratricopeptide (TPR) repeat protein